MKLFRNILLSIVAAATVLLPLSVSADGMVVSPSTVYVEETEQKAVIFYEPTTAMETMVVGIAYEGTANDFAWLIPTPGKPAVERGSQQLFSNLEELTAYTYSYSELDYGISDVPASQEIESGVTVIDELAVDYYDVVVLEATSSFDLVAWLEKNGYYFPPTNTYILDSYIKAGWYFTAMRVNDTVNQIGVGAQLHDGTATPVQLTFPAANIVYPLRVSSIVDEVRTTGTITDSIEVDPYAYDYGYYDEYDSYSYDDDYQDISVYVITDHRVQASDTDFWTNYADWVTADEIESWARDVNGNPWIEPLASKYFLTEVSAYFTTDDMNEDIFFTQSYSDDVIDNVYDYSWDDEDYIEFGAIAFIVTVLTVAVGLFTPFGIAHIVYSFIRGLAKKRSWKIAAHILQWLNLLLYAVIVAVVWALIWEDTMSELGRYMKDYLYTKDAGVIVGFFGGSVLVIKLLFLAILIQSLVIWVRRRKRRKENTEQKSEA